MNAPISVLRGHDKPVNCIKFLKESNSHLLASGDSKGLVKIWNLESKRCVKNIIDSHTDSVTSVSLLAQHLVTFSKDEDLKIWDLNVDSALLRTFKTGYCGFCNAATDVNTVSHEWKDVVITPSRETCEILFCDIRMSDGI